MPAGADLAPPRLMCDHSSTPSPADRAPRVVAALQLASPLDHPALDTGPPWQGYCWPNRIYSPGDATGVPPCPRTWPSPSNMPAGADPAPPRLMCDHCSTSSPADRAPRVVAALQLASPLITPPWIPDHRGRVTAGLTGSIHQVMPPAYRRAREHGHRPATCQPEQISHHQG